jgi:hypothetical protein
MTWAMATVTMVAGNKEGNSKGKGKGKGGKSKDDNNKGSMQATAATWAMATATIRQLH